MAKTTTCCMRSIPAWAGETPSPPAARAATGVYPRVGGGNIRRSKCKMYVIGLSPRGRGKRRSTTTGARYGGSIPAWAGETLQQEINAILMKVYPRVGGGNGRRERFTRHIRGLSPRGRGKPNPPILTKAKARSIPAWAGETELDWMRHEKTSVYPRVGGGN